MIHLIDVKVFQIKALIVDCWLWISLSVAVNSWRPLLELTPMSKAWSIWHTWCLMAMDQPHWGGQILRPFPQTYGLCLKQASGSYDLPADVCKVVNIVALCDFWKLDVDHLLWDDQTVFLKLMAYVWNMQAADTTYLVSVKSSRS